jgi:hypothetical protein
MCIRVMFWSCCASGCEHVHIAPCLSSQNPETERIRNSLRYKPSRWGYYSIKSGQAGLKLRVSISTFSQKLISITCSKSASLTTHGCAQRSPPCHRQRGTPARLPV